MDLDNENDNNASMIHNQCPFSFQIYGEWVENLAWGVLTKHVCQEGQKL